MKTALLIMLVNFSFLAVCRAEVSTEVDEFELFEKAPATKVQDKASKSPVNPSPAVKAASPADVVVKPAKSETPTEKIERLKAQIRRELKNDPTKFHLIPELAEELARAGETEKATALLWKYVEKIDRKTLVFLATTHEKRDEPDQMIKALNLLIARDPKDYEAYYLLGNAYFAKGKPKDAFTNYKNSIEANSKYEPAYQGLVVHYEKQKNLYELRILFQDMVDNIGPRAPYLSKLCDVNTRDGTFEAAIIQCRDAISKNSNDIEAHVNLGLALKGTGDTPASLKSLKYAAEHFPNSELAQFSYGRSLEEQKNFVDAFAYYKAATTADEKSARAWLGTATAAFELQKMDVSLNAFKAACKLDRMTTSQFRKAAAQLVSAKNTEWSKKFSAMSESCSYGK